MIVNLPLSFSHSLRLPKSIYDITPRAPLPSCSHVNIDHSCGPSQVEIHGRILPRGVAFQAFQPSYSRVLARTLDTLYLRSVD